MGYGSVLGQRMRFPSQDRFLQYVASKRRTYLRTLRERGDGRGFFALWKSEWDFATGAFSIDGLSPGQARFLGRAARWLLLHDLVGVVRDVAPDFGPVPATVVDALPAALHQARSVRSMLVAGPRGSGRESLAILVHVLTGRPALLVRVESSEVGRGPGAVGAADLPERGSILLAEIETAPPAGQAELAEFLAGEGRLRDLFVFSTTSTEPREIAARFGHPRDLLMRTGQAEVRLAPLAGAVAQAHVEDLVFDLSAVPNDRLPALREEARDLAATWAVPGGRDSFEEAASWLAWREKARLATASLADPGFARLRAEAAGLGDREAMRARVAAHLGARDLRSRQDAAPRGARPVVRPPAGTAIGPATPVPASPAATAPAHATPARAEAPGHAAPPAPPSSAVAPAAGTASAPAQARVEARESSTAAAGSPSAPAPLPAKDAPAPLAENDEERASVPTSMRRDDLLRAYYEALLDEESGDLRRVAARAGRKLRVLQAELERLGVRPQRTLPLAPAKRTA